MPQINQGTNINSSTKQNINATNNKKQQKRNIIWFNPPYSRRRTNQHRKIFLNLIKKHFPPQHKLYKLCNKNLVKIRYSCTGMIKTIIDSSNTTVLFSTISKKQKTMQLLKQIHLPIRTKIPFLQIPFLKLK